ncbi:hypothetical protein C8034_v002022 [Colletotrichum sidae]|uniref:NPP1 domain-containing protein n=1 Tax=Colletotrichum sidae TaxID=1347389 RepID=A0A4V3I2N6_9PEZI|nr:hypothetical protein C8034_v002022 [Colletotrichum sidae]
MRYLLCLLLLASFLCLGNATVSRRDGDVAVGENWEHHDKIESFPKQSDEDLFGELEDRFAPLLYAWRGCIPYPAVNADGKAGAGLRPTGDDGGDCRDFNQPGQTYTRVGSSNRRWAVLYSWYLPKVMGDAEQHKHHWLTVVLWLAFKTCPDEVRNFFPRGISYSTSPGKFDTERGDVLWVSNGTEAATHPLVAYNGGQIIFPSDKQYDGPLSPALRGWDTLPQPAKDQLNGIRYEHTKVPFSDANFQTYLDAAYNPDFYKDISADWDCNTIDASFDADL